MGAPRPLRWAGSDCQPGFPSPPFPFLFPTSYTTPFLWGTGQGNTIVLVGCAVSVFPPATWVQGALTALRFVRPPACFPAFWWLARSARLASQPETLRVVGSRKTGRVCAPCTRLRSLWLA